MKVYEVDEALSRDPKGVVTFASLSFKEEDYKEIVSKPDIAWEYVPYLGICRLHVKLKSSREDPPSIDLESIPKKGDKAIREWDRKEGIEIGMETIDYSAANQVCYCKVCLGI